MLERYPFKTAKNNLLRLFLAFEVIFSLARLFLINSLKRFFGVSFKTLASIYERKLAFRQRGLHAMGTSKWCPSRADQATQERSESVLTLATQNRESRNAQFPEWQAWNRQKLPSEKQNNESKRSRVESREIRFGIAIRIASYQCVKQPWNRRTLNRSVLDSESPINGH